MKIRYALAGALLAYATMIGGSAYAADLIADTKSARAERGRGRVQR
jgi:hypothetical protein